MWRVLWYSFRYSVLFHEETFLTESDALAYVSDLFDDYPEGVHYVLFPPA